MPTPDGKNMSESQLPLETSPAAKSASNALVPLPALPQPIPRPDFAPPAALSGMPNLMALLKALYRRLLPALIVGLLVSAAAGTAMWNFLPPPKQIARTQLYVPAVPVKILGDADNRLSGDAFLRNQGFIIKDRFILSYALNYPEVAKLQVIKEQTDQLQWLETEIKVEFPGPEFIQISMSGDQPKELLVLVNAVRKAYLEKTADKELIARDALMVNLKNILDDWEGRSKLNKKKLRDLQERAGAANPENMALVQKIALEELAAAQKDLVRVRSEIRQLRVEIGLRPEWREAEWPRYVLALNTTPASVSPLHFAVVGLLHDEFLVSGRYSSEAIEQLLALDPIIAPTIKKMDEVEAMIEGIRRVSRGDQFERLAKSHKEHLEALKKQVDEYVKRKGEAWLKHLREQAKVAGANNQGASTRERYAAALALEKILDEEAKKLDEMTANRNRQAVDLAEIKDEIDKAADIISRASKKRDALEIEQKAPPRVEPFGDGSTYAPDVTKRQVMFTAGAAVGGLLLVLLAFAWVEFQTRKVHSPDEVVHSLGLRLVGTVPDLSQNNWLKWLRPNAGDSTYTQSLLTESVDTARTFVLHAARTDKLQIVMVTSALAGEGKTSLASHLAASLARAGRRTLLLDSDLRNPSLHRLFDMTRGPGLAEVLRGETDLTGAIRETPIPNLRLISAGQSDPVALQTLALDNMQQVFDQLRPQYEFILVDSCPVLPVADSLLVGQHVDAVIFSLLREISRMPRVYAAYQRLAMLGIRILGAVVNGTQHDRYGATGYNYRYVNTED
jgi:capsular exopolysaccharide synthesis family protein